ncbi:MAG: hypothetical protein HRU70_14770 [Phycisphaeraceae bacterium]|nr:MAG: hypothetical protein HRU70_14770 [Phycisphaeraceae bacterium]
MPESFFPCSSCGADLAFQPGTTSLTCVHCGATTRIDGSAEAVEEEDFHAALNEASRGEAMVDVIEVPCPTCGARAQLGPNVTAEACPYCGSSVVAQGRSVKVFRPKSLLPFHVDRKGAEGCYEKWLSSLWFAPSNLRKVAYLDAKLSGVYLPHWTYDCTAITKYTGKKGIDYYTTETYTAMVNGRPTTRTRTVKKTRWYPASGTVRDDFDDVLIPATTSLPKDRLIALEPWDLKALVPYTDAYLAGFRAESYAVPLDVGFEHATVRMRPMIERTIRADIGGDHQIITSMKPAYRDITFKHLLLPVWLTAYRYHGKTYHIMINARTGEVGGERPYSAWKIVLVVLGVLALAGIVALIVSQAR